MYFYPDNIQESILLLQNGEFDYGYLKQAPKGILESSKIDTGQLNKERWNLTVWNITNVLPIAGRVEEGIASFPEEIPRRLIKLFTMVGETVFDPFAGSGTTLKVAQELGRKGIGYEVDLELKRVIRKKLGGENVVIEEREGAKRLRKSLQTRIQQRRSVAKSPVSKLIL
jgi:DNA modification methylase